MSKDSNSFLSKVYKHTSTLLIPGCHLVHSGVGAGRSRNARQQGPNGLGDRYENQGNNLVVDGPMSLENKDQNGVGRSAQALSSSTTSPTSSLGFPPPAGPQNCALLSDCCCMVDLSDTEYSAGADCCASNNRGSSYSSYSCSSNTSSSSNLMLQWSRSSSSLCFPSYGMLATASFLRSHPHPHAAARDSHFVLPLVDLMAFDCAGNNPDHGDGGEGTQEAAPMRATKAVATATATAVARLRATAAEAGCGGSHGGGPHHGGGFLCGGSSGPHRQRRQRQFRSHQRVYPE
ncbi:hypothetical protein Vretimale_7435 [Volvox reticuliferus]|uniref:Uncharacterized protein n=1 Tax=Volvox reticuliferus TaxID=1737510 RepID=A0A8J4FMD9_9CHLO|nr:hypothetical protein Vretifemale_7552 [Volvox reticuliferus]GIM02647.1 hypothetical protein Vretimale_7435 [Volvox reticuliferus]